MTVDLVVCVQEIDFEVKGEYTDYGKDDAGQGVGDWNEFCIYLENSDVDLSEVLNSSIIEDILKKAEAEAVGC